MGNISRYLQNPKIESLLLMAIRASSLGSKFILSLFIAKYMGLEILGVFGLVVSATFLLPSFTGLGLMYVKGRDAITQNTAEIVYSVRLILKYFFILYAFITAVTVAVGVYTDHLVFAIVLCTIVFFEHLNNDFYALLLNRSMQYSANILHAIRNTAWILAFMALAFFIKDIRTLEFLLLCYAIGSFFALVGFFFVTRNWSWKEKGEPIKMIAWIKETFKKSKFIYFYGIVDSTGQYVNHYIVSLTLGMEMTGVYVFFYQIIWALANLMRTGVIQKSRAKFVKALNSSYQEFKKVRLQAIKETYLFSIVLGVLIIPFIFVIVKHVMHRDLLLEYFLLLPILLIYFMGMMRYEANQLTLYSIHKDHLMFRLTLIYASLLMITSPFVAMYYGLYGLAALCIVLEIVRNLLQDSFIKKELMQYEQ